MRGPGLWVLVTAGFALLAGCSYGPPRNTVDAVHAVAKPDSHMMAIGASIRRQRDPQSFFATFPDGGAPQILAREARIYLVDIDSRSIRQIARFPDFEGIPQPKVAAPVGWQGDELYLRLFGYGGSEWTGDDMSDERRLHFRVSRSGAVERIDQLPTALETAPQTGPTREPPFLRISQGHLALDVGIDARPGEGETVRMAFDEETGEPAFVDRD